MSRRLILNIVGARPNFVKIAPLIRAMKSRPMLTPLLVNTGQHYDDNMSAIFLRQLDIPTPDYDLQVGSGSHAVQTAGIMVRFEQLCLKLRPHAVIVVGDVNSTLACSLVAAKLLIRLGHVEAGLRSRDRSMPEEINRLVTDALGDWLFTPSRDADENLLMEGIPRERIFRVGNIMIDSVVENLKRIEESTILKDLGLCDGHSDGRIVYGVITVHRPSNVDDCEVLTRIIDCLDELQKEVPLVFAAHPRTRKQLEKYNLWRRCREMRQLQVVEPMGYIEFLALCRSATFVLTDSGGLQEETTYLKIPCLTLRPNTERAVTVTVGSNELVTIDRILGCVDEILSGRWKRSAIPELWDGATAGRICDVIVKALDNS